VGTGEGRAGDVAGDAGSRAAAGGICERDVGISGGLDGRRTSPVGKEGGPATTLRGGSAVRAIAGISADAIARPSSVRVWRTTRVDLFIAVLRSPY